MLISSYNQLTVQGEADNMFRFFTSAVDATFLPLTICLSGEMLSTQVGHGTITKESVCKAMNYV